MTKKEKLILSGIIIGLGTAFNLFFTAALHGMLARYYDTLTLIPLRDCIKGLLTQRQQLMLFLSFEGFTVLACLLFFIQNSRSYQSRLIKITDDIYTPAPVGQYQHGSARWLTEKEKEKVFDCYTLDPKNEVIAKLIETGLDNLDFLSEEVEESTEASGQDADKKQTPESEKKTPSQTPQPETENIRQNEAEAEEPCFEKVDYQFEAYPAKGKSSQTKADQSTPGQHKEALPADAHQHQKPEKPALKTQKDPYKILKSGGIVVGMTKKADKEKIYYISDDTHTLTIGATRSGKTRTLVIQSICTLGLAGESLVISDPKAELFHYTSEFLKKIGYEVICIDFKNPAKSTRYNPLQPIIDAVNAGNMEKAEMYAWDITNILVGDNVSNEKIWENGEKSTIAAAILCVVVDNAKRPEFQNLTNVYWFVAEMCKNVGSKIPMTEYVKKLKSSHPARALLSISDVAPSRTRGSFYTSALTTLRLFTSKSIYSITNKSDFDISRIGSRKQALFFILPDEKTTYYPVSSLMVSQLYEILVRKSDERGGRLENRVNFVLDEFGNFTKLSDFTNKLTVGGGRGIRFNLFLQSFDQLEEKYNKETAGIVKSNCQTWVYLQADDKNTLQDICDKLGRYTTSAYQLSSQHGQYVNPSSSHTISLVARDLLTTDEIRRVSRPYQIVISRSHPAMMVSPDLSEWYFNRMCGLGGKEHNRKVREERERKRPILSDVNAEIPLWNIWVYYVKDLQLKEEKQKQQVLSAQAGAIFSEKMRKGGKRGLYDDEDDD